MKKNFQNARFYGKGRQSLIYMYIYNMQYENALNWIMHCI